MSTTISGVCLSTHTSCQTKCQFGKYYFGPCWNLAHRYVNNFPTRQLCENAFKGRHFDFPWRSLVHQKTYPKFGKGFFICQKSGRVPIEIEKILGLFVQILQDFLWPITNYLLSQVSALLRSGFSSWRSFQGAKRKDSVLECSKKCQRYY